jgi:hypothetical protein
MREEQDVSLELLEAKQASVGLEFLVIKLKIQLSGRNKVV